MAQIFPRFTNTIARFTIFGAVFVLAAVGWIVWAMYRSAWVTEARVVRDQPVPFSHKHHVSDDGIDCRYCHTSVEDSSFAGIPATKTCMSCHSQIFAENSILEPVRESFRSDKPIQWVRVNDLPNFAYFQHDIHVNKGIGCSTCHGPVDQMPLTWRENSLLMEWCLGCHRQPERYLRPREEIFNMKWEAPPDQIQKGKKLLQEYHIDTRAQRLTDCWTCHR
jgi:hypothetical protein